MCCTNYLHSFHPLGPFHLGGALRGEIPSPLEAPRCLENFPTVQKKKNKRQDRFIAEAKSGYVINITSNTFPQICLHFELPNMSWYRYTSLNRELVETKDVY